MKAPPGQRVIVRALADAVAELPSIRALNAQEIGDADILICVLGFEDRCLAIPRALAEADRSVRATAVCRYTTNSADNARNEKRLYGYLAKLAPGAPRELPVGSGDLGTALRTLIAENTRSGSPPRILVDVSVASNTLIIRALATLSDLEAELHVLYAEADSYRPSRSEFQARQGQQGDEGQGQLARGVLDVTITSEFPGRHAVGLPQRIVVFPGFDRDRVRAAISQVDADFIMEPTEAPLVWMVSRPLHEEDSWRQMALIDLHDVPSHHERHVVSTFDYREAMAALEEVHRRYGLESNLFVVPLGSKMQAIGVALFCVARREVAVVVSQPREYHAVAYSRGFRSLWHLPLGQTSEMCRSLRTVDTVQLEPLETLPEGTSGGPDLTDAPP